MSQIANNFSTEVFSVASASFYSEDDSLKGIKKKKRFNTIHYQCQRRIKRKIHFIDNKLLSFAFIDMN